MLAASVLAAIGFSIAQAPAASIASAAVVAPSGGAACDDIQRAVAEHPDLPTSERWEVDPKLAIELEVEAITPFPARPKRAATFAVIVSCRSSGAKLDERPLRQHAVLVSRDQKNTTAIDDIVRAGDAASHLEAIVPFVVDVDADGRPELGLRGTIVEEQGAERTEGDAEVFLFFGTGKKKNAGESRLVIRKRVRRTIAKEDGVIERTGIAERAFTAGGKIFVEESIFIAADEAALDKWRLDSSVDDVLARTRRTKSARFNGDRVIVSPITAGKTVLSDGSERAIIQTGDSELTIFEGEKSIAKMPFRGRIARIVRDHNHLYAAVYVAESEDTRELYLIDLTTSRFRKLPRHDGEEIALWSWSPDGSYAVFSGGSTGLVACAMKQLESWIAGDAIATSEVKIAGGRLSFVRWIGPESFEVAVKSQHHRYDAKSKRAIKLYEVPLE